MRFVHRCALWLGVLAVPLPGAAQTRLSVQDAVETALRLRPLLKAEAERVSVARGTARQAGLWANPQFEFSSENLRPGQHFGRDVETQAVITQPLDVLGKRGGRRGAAEALVRTTAEEYEQSRRDVARRVELAYWAARGAQERRDLLRASVDTFQQIVSYHAARFSVGAIPEQDVLRVRLEREQIVIAAHLATIDATDARIALLTEMGRPPDENLVLTDPLEAQPPLAVLATDAALGERSDVRVARAALEQARANARLQDVLARPDLSVSAGYKRTSVSDAAPGANTAVAGVLVTIPVIDRNQGNRDAAAAGIRRQQQLLAETESLARAELERVRATYELRRGEVRDTLTPLREHATSIAGIARAAYQQGGVELLRLLDAERARLDAERAWVDGMVAFQQSVTNLKFAQGAAR